MKNNYRIVEEKVFIEIFYKGERYETIIDLDDLEKVDKEFSKIYASNKRGIYAVGYNKDRKYRGIHRFILQYPEDEVDHHDSNTLNNTKSNLSIVTRSMNRQNLKSAHKNSKSGVRNVYWNRFRNNWIVKIKHDKKVVYLKGFKDFDEACRVAEEKRKELQPYSKEAKGYENKEVEV